MTRLVGSEMCIRDRFFADIAEFSEVVGEVIGKRVFSEYDVNISENAFASVANDPTPFWVPVDTAQSTFWVMIDTNAR
jgi:hypothetical protein